MGTEERLPEIRKPDWADEQVFGKIMNLERPGDDVFICLNGYAIQCQDGAEVEIPIRMANFIDTIEYEDWVKLHPDREPDKVMKKRFAFIRKERVFEKNQAKDEIIAKALAQENEANDDLSGDL